MAQVISIPIGNDLYLNPAGGANPRVFFAAVVISLGGGLVLAQSGTPGPPPAAINRVTTDGDQRVTTTGDDRVLTSSPSPAITRVTTDGDQRTTTYGQDRVLTS